MLVQRASRFAEQAHAGQVRADGVTPYFAHPCAVVDALCEAGWDAMDYPEMIAAAYLHDVLEDTSVTHAELAAEFGEVVAGVVRELTDPPGTGKPEQLRRLLDASATARTIKLADKLANVRDMYAGDVFPVQQLIRRGASARRLAAGLRHVCPLLADKIIEAVNEGEADRGIVSA